ncbi:hypothetical protein [Stutzerimonas stutzeri]|uniref:hypothetical protein n=1 Tax=Stutzerimonas stutzeri TaxID=316 RepID=UPI0015E3F119|nr:hypothetical protein [Stutzerimonas stutzeri]MBA1280221.1 hypothetical protein [Stutzerimonas stutzeri]
MLITDYLVGRDRGQNCLALVVKDVLPLGCSAGRCHLVRKLNRQDLVQEFVQDGVPTDWLMFPDLPADVIALLEKGEALTIVDAADDSSISCVIEPVRQAGTQVRG